MVSGCTQKHQVGGIVERLGKAFAHPVGMERGTLLSRLTRGRAIDSDIRLERFAGTSGESKGVPRTGV